MCEGKKNKKCTLTTHKYTHTHEQHLCVNDRSGRTESVVVHTLFSSSFKIFFFFFCNTKKISTSTSYHGNYMEKSQRKCNALCLDLLLIRRLLSLLLDMIYELLTQSVLNDKITNCCLDHLSTLAEATTRQFDSTSILDVPMVRLGLTSNEVFIVSKKKKMKNKITNE